MSHEVKLLPNELIVFMVWYEDFNLKAEMADAADAVRAHFDAVSVPHCLIVDVRAAQLGMEDLLIGTNYVLQGSDPLLKHANLRQVILIAQNRAIELTVKGIKAASFGHIDIKICATTDEALAHARG